MTDLLNAEDIKKAVGAFSGEWFFPFFFLLSFPPFISLGFDSCAFILATGRLEELARQNFK